jgi:hypothetical protein
MLATEASEARPGVENPKILPRSTHISVILSKEEASGYRCVMQYNLSFASALADTLQKCECGVGWRFVDFWGGAINSAKRFLIIQLIDKRMYNTYQQFLNKS